jgi:hypothetical protein
MPVTSQEPIEQAERELAEVKGLVDEQFGLVMRLVASIVGVWLLGLWASGGYHLH